jgi:hypothetical protein
LADDWLCRIRVFDRRLPSQIDHWVQQVVDVSKPMPHVEHERTTWRGILIPASQPLPMHAFQEEDPVISPLPILPSTPRAGIAHIAGNTHFARKILLLHLF